MFLGLLVFSKKIRALFLGLFVFSKKIRTLFLGLFGFREISKVLFFDTVFWTVCENRFGLFLDYGTIFLVFRKQAELDTHCNHKI